jgi:hypothetical protein
MARFLDVEGWRLYNLGGCRGPGWQQTRFKSMTTGGIRNEEAKELRIIHIRENSGWRGESPILVWEKPGVPMEACTGQGFSLRFRASIVLQPSISAPTFHFAREISLHA